MVGVFQWKEGAPSKDVQTLPLAKDAVKGGEGSEVGQADGNVVLVDVRCVRGSQEGPHALEHGRHRHLLFELLQRVLHAVLGRLHVESPIQQLGHCVCVRVRACVRVCVCVCEREREREEERGSEKGKRDTGAWAGRRGSDSRSPF